MQLFRYWPDTGKSRVYPLIVNIDVPIAFLIGPKPRRTIAIASVSTGRMTSRIEFAKADISQIAPSPRGDILYCVAAGDIWAVPRAPSGADGEPRRIRSGNFVTVEPGGQSIVVELQEPPNTRLIRVPLKAGLPSGPEQEISLAGPLKLGFGIDPDAVRNGRLVAPESAPTWYWPPAIFDLATGKSARIPLDYTSDFHYMSWTADGKILAFAMGWRSSMWKFTPEKSLPH